MKLSIVFLNYNRLAETKYTLAHLKKLTQKRQDIEVIAVDNDSKDGTGAYLQTQTDWMHAILLNDNTGIAGYNEGFKLAKGDYIFVLDDDSHPVDIETLDRLIHILDTQQEIGVVACQIESSDGEIFKTWHLPKHNQAEEAVAFVGCGFAIRRDLFAQVDWYPSEFFLYQNEIEVAIRVLLAGYKIYYEPQCRVVHRQSPTGRTNWRRVYYPTRNTIWIIRRYFPYPQAFYMIFSRLCFGLIRTIQAREFTYYFKAIKEAFAEPVPRQILPPELRKKLTVFWRQNSLFHQLIGWL